jgi:hypothetical protein
MKIFAEYESESQIQIQIPLKKNPKDKSNHESQIKGFVDARQRNERDARMGAEETGLEEVDSGSEQVESSAEFCCFY